METLISSTHDTIGNHNKAVVRGETANDNELYYDTFFDVTADDNNTWPWETELNDLPLAHQDITALDNLDKYIGTKIVLPGRDGEHILTVAKDLK